jgi:tRNA pseudouridine38-40 synthase
MVVFEIRANAFCHQMVRSLVGFLVDVGLGKRPASDTRAVMLEGNRNHGSPVAPPQGLVLWDVGYDGERVHP